MKAKLIVSIVILACVLLYTLQNTESVSISFALWSLSASKAIVTLGTFLVGIVFGFVLGKLDTRKEKKTNREGR